MSAKAVSDMTDVELISVRDVMLLQIQLNGNGIPKSDGHALGLILANQYDAELMRRQRLPLESP